MLNQKVEQIIMKVKQVDHNEELKNYIDEGFKK
jgi:hypothetical protein